MNHQMYPTNLQSAHKEIDKLRSKINDIAEAALHIIDHPEGCRCGNNGGADCDFCLFAENFRNTLNLDQQDKINDALPDPTCPQCGDTPFRGEGSWRWTATKDWDHRCRNAAPELGHWKVIS